MPGTVVYDADCGFCLRCAAWLDRHGTCGLRPWQELELASYGLTEDDVTRAAQWIDESGRVTQVGAGAIASAMLTCGPGWRLLGRLGLSRPLRPLADALYALLVRFRHRLPGATDTCRVDRGPVSQPPISRD